MTIRVHIPVVIHANPDASIAVTKIRVEEHVQLHVKEPAAIDVLMVVQEGVGQVVTAVVAAQVILQLKMFPIP